MSQTNYKQPLSVRMRPKKLDDIIGQKHILGKEKLLYRAIASDRLESIILYGPPGTGKTSIASVIANTTKAEFIEMNATAAGKKDMEKAVARANKLLETENQKTLLFIDEIHRFNKAQQDYLLPFVESGLISLIGATTENPYFEVNKALLSRSRIFELKPLTPEDIKQAIQNALNDHENGVPKNTILETDALDFLANACSGDIRGALNALEIGYLTTPYENDGTQVLTLSVIEDCIQKKAVYYDKNGDQHYDIISAFIKSMRGSDPDATLYYLARMLEAGEDIKYIARRIMIHACEDVGMADPNALVIATSASLACERIGLPESNLILAQAALYVACAPKSNAVCTGINTAQELVKETGLLEIPKHLQDCHYGGAKKLGRGDEYKYPHDYPNHYVKQQYLPDEIQHVALYNPNKIGAEISTINWLNQIIKEERNRLDKQQS